MALFSRRPDRSSRKVDHASELVAALDRIQAIIWFEPDGTIIEANENFLKVAGYAASEILGKHHRMFVPREDAAHPDYARFWESLREGQPQAREFRRIDRNGREFWIQASYNPVCGPDGRVARVVKFATDITADKLRTADAQGLIAAASRVQAMIEFELDGTIRNANDNFLAAMGYTLDEIRGRHHRMFVDPAEARSADYGAFWQGLARGEPATGEFRRIAKGGREVWLIASYNPILDMNGRPFKVVKFATDVTTRKSAVVALDDGLRRLAQGDLGARIPTAVGGEFAVLRDSFNESAARLEGLVTQILELTDGIAATSRAIGEGAGALAERSETQASAVEETSAAITEMSASARSNAAIAEEADHGASEATSLAQRGSAVLAEAVSSMDRIAATAGRIGSIMSVIESIAFQTNLLALNAAVEAARAGEAGKGFAVVATEVRTLAQRASDAARDIGTLVRSSTEEIAGGVSLVRQSGTALDEIRAAVGGLTGHLSRISLASREQASAVSETATAAAEIEDLTRQNRDLAERSAAQAAQLDSHARSLGEAVGFFRVSDTAAAPLSASGPGRRPLSRAHAA